MSKDNTKEDKISVKTNKIADEKAKKKKKQDAEDRDYRENEIKFGIRVKLISVVSVIVLLVVITITWIATINQTDALMVEKKKQGEIIETGLNSAIKTGLIDIIAGQNNKLSRLKEPSEFRNFYSNNFISDEIFEFIDQVKSQPDVIYAYFLGKHGIVLGHTDTKIDPYSYYQFEKGITSYFDAYKTQRLTSLEPILQTTTIILPPQKGEKKGEEVEVIDFSRIVTFKSDPELSDAFGEIHIGISLDAINDQIFASKVQMQLIGFASILFGIGMAVIMATLIARPIRKMIEGMRLVSKGDFSVSVLSNSKDEVGLLSKTFNVMLKGLSILVSPEVARVVLSGEDLTKSGQRKTVTVLFSDIRGFTTISESLTPPQVVEMLNDYMEIMTEIIIKYGGVVDKFVGDEIFAVYGAPFDHPLHPLCAVATALDMGTDLAAHNKEREAEGKLPISIGIGVNTGDVIAGAMGSKKRIDFTSIGDAVNLGARLEGTNKVYGTLAIISEFTLKEVKGDLIVRELDSILVKGKLEPVMIFEAVALTESGHKKLEKYTQVENS
ncbi:MAG: adenylate/guanylate cyclase domain-containing protein [Leptospirales bacterium]